MAFSVEAGSRISSTTRDANRRCVTERRATHDNYLKRTVFCGSCHKQHVTSRLSLMLANGHGGSYYYFFCRGRQVGSGCRQRFIQGQ